MAREAIELARDQIAALAGVPASRIVFTSGATEAANTAAASVGPESVVFCSPVEHSCVREAAARAGHLVQMPVGADGSVDLERLSGLLGRLVDGASVLVHCQWANHEVGTIQPVQEVAALCAACGAALHVDAAAAFGHVPTDFGSLGAEYASVSAHKMGGPAGVGALILGRGVRVRPLLVGGSEERARRAGSENLIGIVGFGAAAAELVEEGRLAAESAGAAGRRDELAACRDRCRRRRGPRAVSGRSSPSPHHVRVDRRRSRGGGAALPRSCGYSRPLRLGLLVGGSRALASARGDGGRPGSFAQALGRMVHHRRRHCCVRRCLLRRGRRAAGARPGLSSYEYLFV